MFSIYREIIKNHFNTVSFPSPNGVLMFSIQHRRTECGYQQFPSPNGVLMFSIDALEIDYMTEEEFPSPNGVLMFSILPSGSLSLQCFSSGFAAEKKNTANPWKNFF